MAKWDVGRFFNTVNYFGAIPIISDVQRWLNSASHSQSTIDGGRALGSILVVGATGEIGQVVIQQLVKSGYRVKAAIADLSLAPFSIPANVEFVRFPADEPSEWERLMAGVKSIVICPEDRSSISITTLNNLATAAKTYLSPNNNLQIFDFTQFSRDLQSQWGAVDDVVMGGVSESGIRVAEGYALFSGNVSTENSGGFASVRNRNFNPSLNLSNYRGIELRIKGDGQRYKFFVRTEETWDGVGYAYSFDTIADEWLTIQIPFQDLVPIFRAKTVSNAQPIETNRICSFQLMLSKFEYNRALNPRFTPGRFSLQIAAISAYGGKIMPQLAIVLPSLSADNLVSQIQAIDLPCTIVKWETLTPQMVAEIATRSISQPEAVGQILGR